MIQRDNLSSLLLKLIDGHNDLKRESVRLEGANGGDPKAQSTKQELARFLNKV